MAHRQKGKHMKRRKSWHRGRSEARRWDRVADIFGGRTRQPDVAPQQETDRSTS